MPSHAAEGILLNLNQFYYSANRFDISPRFLKLNSQTTIPSKPN
jgi:hypothetical protein